MSWSQSYWFHFKNCSEWS